MKEIKTYPEMNEQISDILKFGDGPEQYAAQYIKELRAENAALRERLKDYEQIESRKNRISKHRREDSQLVADKIARCNKCEYKGTSVEIDGIGKIEICKCPPYKGKWIEEIEQCPKEENLTEERKDDGKGN